MSKKPRSRISHEREQDELERKLHIYYCIISTLQLIVNITLFIGLHKT